MKDEYRVVEKVMCISLDPKDKEGNDVLLDNFNMDHVKISVGEWCRVLERRNSYVIILDGDGQEWILPRGLFMTSAEYREKQIDQLI